MKLKEKNLARDLRKNGKSINHIYKTLGVSKGAVSLWVRDIELTDAQKNELIARDCRFLPKQAGANTNKEKAMAIRKKYQDEGREKSINEPEDYRIMCALYWAEGNKDKNSIGITNTDPDMLKLFVIFLKKYFMCTNDDFTVYVMAHLNNGLTVEEIRDFWIKKLELSNDCFRKFILKTKYYSDSNYKTNKRIYGGCSVRVNSTRIVQTIFGSIQEIFHIERPEWIK